MRRVALAVFLAVVLAGCNVPLGPTGTATPTATPEATDSPTATATPAPGPGSVGLAADGVVEPLTLREAHSAALENRSYTLERTTTVREADGSVALRTTLHVEAGPWRDRFVWNRISRAGSGTPAWLSQLYGENGSVRAYSNETTTVIVMVEDGDRRVAWSDESTTNASSFSGAYRSFAGRPFLMKTFLQVETAVADVERSGGTVRYHLTNARGPHDLRFDTEQTLETRVLSLTATVERSGLVRELVLRYVLTHEGQEYVVRETLRITDLDTTTVERPDWAR